MQRILRGRAIPPQEDVQLRIKVAAFVLAAVVFGLLIWALVRWVNS